MSSTSSNSPGRSTSRTSGTDRPFTAPSTPNHFDCNSFGSPSMIPFNTRFQFIAAFGCSVRILTASFASAGLLPHRIKSSTVRSPSAAACSRHSMIVIAGACHSAFELEAPSPEAPISDADRWFATRGSSHPVIGDHFSVEGCPVRPCGSNNATGPFFFRISAVAPRLSARELVVMTGPGASRIAPINRCTPLPERGGPMSTTDSS